MNRFTFNQYLHKEAKGLTPLLSRLKQLAQWNKWLEKALPEDCKILAQHCHIVNIVGNSLILIADSPQWVLRFRFYHAELLSKLKQYPQLAKINSLCCKARPLNMAFRHSQKTASPQQKLSLTTAKKILNTAETLTDKKLRTILERIATHLRLS